jgi:four helix bundle protein
MEMLRLEELEIYKLSLGIAEEIYSIISKWNYFDKDTIGKQLIRSIDTIGANISEGYGRYHFQENKHFCYFARGSLFESKTWLQKASNRDLISSEIYNDLIKQMELLHIKLNAYIKSIGKKKDQ